MGGKKKQNTVYVPAPAPTATPELTPEQQATNASLQQQLASMQQASQKQIEGMSSQYQKNAETSSSLLAQLQEQLRSQQEIGTSQRAELDRARQLSLEQTQATNNARQGAQAQYSQASQNWGGTQNSLFNKLQRRRQARTTTY